jgi:hypothetical protein
MANLLIALSITNLPPDTNVKIMALGEDMYYLTLNKSRFHIQVKVDGKQEPVSISNRLDEELENAHAFD